MQIFRIGCIKINSSCCQFSILVPLNHGRVYDIIKSASQTWNGEQTCGKHDGNMAFMSVPANLRDGLLVTPHRFDVFISSRINTGRFLFPPVGLYFQQPFELHIKWQWWLLQFSDSKRPPYVIWHVLIRAVFYHDIIFIHRHWHAISSFLSLMWSILYSLLL